MVLAFPSLADTKPGFFETLRGENESLFWVAAFAHLVAMCSAVPLVEEIFNRSLVLRAASDPSGIRAAILQLICEVPVIGGWVARSNVGKWANEYPVSLGQRFSATPLGKLTFTGVAVSTGLFMLVHSVADWPGAVVCGVVWCVQLQRTRQLGLGPVIWSHAMVNGLLWLYVVTGDAWQFI
jgi:membrane protease YdiL (CAAX protease family)